MPGDTTFLNVDLDISLRQGLDALLAHFDSRAFVLNKTDDSADLELTADHVSLDDCLAQWVSAIRQLPPEAQRLWEQCDYRRLNIGFQGGQTPHQTSFEISPIVCKAVAEAGCEVVITIYGTDAAIV